MTDLVKRLREVFLADAFEKGLITSSLLAERLILERKEAAQEIERLTALTDAPASVTEHNVDDLVAGDAYRDTLLPRADSHAADGSPLWFGWAIMGAFIAGANHARAAPPPPQEPGDGSAREIIKVALEWSDCGDPSSEAEDELLARLASACSIYRNNRRAKGE